MLDQEEFHGGGEGVEEVFDLPEVELELTRIGLKIGNWKVEELSWYFPEDR